MLVAANVFHLRSSITNWSSSLLLLFLLELRFTPSSGQPVARPCVAPLVFFFLLKSGRMVPGLAPKAVAAAVAVVPLLRPAGSGFRLLRGQQGNC